MGLFHWISDTLWPLRCLGCRAYESALCLRCVAGIPVRSHQECIVCKRPSRYGAPCAACRRHAMVNRLLVAGHADHPLLSRAIHTFKYEHVYDLAGPLTDYLIGALYRKESGQAAFPENPLFVPVPLHPRRLAERGFNQSDLLARRIASTIGMAHRSDILARVRYTASQVGTASRWERLENMKDAFACVHPKLVADRDIVLVDDVCTTGATLDACAAALSTAGARTVIGLALARG